VFEASTARVAVVARAFPPVRPLIASFVAASRQTQCRGRR
jgi:hypothetical protein